MSGPELRSFSADEAGELAREVVHHDPGIPRTELLVPQDSAAAAVGVRELAVQLENLPKSIRAALQSARDNAGYLSEDRLQGIAELIQNADDLGATVVYVAVDPLNSRLLFGHNGTALTLHDVWALAIPWLSLKVTNDELLGRYGIGLSTLHSLSDVLEVRQGHFQVRLDSRTIGNLESAIQWPGYPNASSGTVFAAPFSAGALAAEDVADWLTRWGEAGLVFLRSLSTITLVDEAGTEITRLHIEHGRDDELHLEHGTALRRTITASNGRQWIVYVRRAPTPAGVTRAGKAQGLSTPVACAFPQFAGDVGHLHVGLPVRPIGLPFRIAAQFDPLANRRSIADTDWNLSLLPILSDLWHDAALDLFARRPSLAWAAVPLLTEFADDERTTGRLREAIATHLLSSARRTFADALRLDGGEGLLPLAELAYEAAELTDLLSAADVRQLSGRKGAVAATARSTDDRWRRVLDELRELGAETPALVDVESALHLLDDLGRPAEFVAALVAIAVKSELAGALSMYPCLVLEDGSRAVPSGRRDLDVLLPAGSGPLWATLGMGSRLHPAFGANSGWEDVREWLQGAGLLRATVTDTDALLVLSEAGRSGDRLAQPLTDQQIEAIRRALEDVDNTERLRLGEGIGQAVELDVVTYDASGNRIATHARPCEAYIIEHDSASWSSAAGRTAGLKWLHRRYSLILRTNRGREGIASQRLFRLLGAETAPRIVAHPENEKRYVYEPPGVWSHANGSPDRRTRLLADHGAAYTVQDWLARDLDAVLMNISKETDVQKRRRRAIAVLATLFGARDRLDPYATVRAALDYQMWRDRGRVEAWWVSSAASIAWLTAENGTAAAPDALSIKSAVNIAFQGDDPGLYLDSTLDIELYRETLAKLGVAGDPTVRELMEKLEEIREGTLEDPVSAQNRAAPLYQALMPHIRRNHLGEMPTRAARDRFGRGNGLIATARGWRRPSVVLAGPAIFGDLRDFVPAVSGTEPLWNLLGIPRPTAADARGVLGDLARQRRRLDGDDRMVMLEALRLLSSASPEQLAQVGELRRAAVWVGDKWLTKRPVYAISNPLIAEALKERLPIWEPGGTLSQFGSLIKRYGLTRLDYSQGQVLDAEMAMYDPDLSQIFSGAVGNLQADLAMSDQAAEASLTLSWETLAGFRVAVMPNLQVRLVEEAQGTDETMSLDAWLDPATETLYVTGGMAAAKPRAGGYAIASVFTEDSRRISHDWVAAWSGAEEGYQAEQIMTAARLDAEQKKERDEAIDQSLRDMSERGKAGRKGQGSKRTASFAAGGSSAEPSAPKSKPPRLLVDPDELELRNDDGELVGQKPDAEGRSAQRPSGGLRRPDTSRPYQPSTRGLGPQNYTDAERQSVGMRLVRRVLGGDEQEIVDIRHQHNVGADAVDQLDNFYELKVQSGPIPDEISLTRAEYLLAQETKDWFLVVVGNVEQGSSEPEVRIIPNALHQLPMMPQGSVTLTGVRSAKALRYSFQKRPPDEEPQPSTDA
jgi:hypothetical protein